MDGVVVIAIESILVQIHVCGLSEVVVIRASKAVGLHCAEPGTSQASAAGATCRTQPRDSSRVLCSNARGVPDFSFALRS